MTCFGIFSLRGSAIIRLEVLRDEDEALEAAGLRE